MPQPYHRQNLEPLGLVAGMFDALGVGAVRDRATQPNPEPRMVTVGNAVKALVRNGLGVGNQQRYRVPMVFQHTPTPRLLAPGLEASHRHDDTLGRALATLEAYGVTALYRLVATTAAHRRGLPPTFAPLESPSFPGEGRDNSAEEPAAQVLHMTPGDRREQRPDLHHVRLDLIVAHQAGIPLRRQPRSGTTRATLAFGHVVSQHIQPRHTPYGTTSLVADRALYRDEHLHKLADPGSQGITRVPAPLTDAQAALAEADPAGMVPLTAGDRAHVCRSTDGGVVQRGVRISSDHRRRQAPRPVDRPRLQPRTAAATAFKQLRRPACACAADAHQALRTCRQGWQVPPLHPGTLRATPRAATRGRPGHATPPPALG